MGVRCVRGWEWRRTYFVEISVYLESRSRYPTWGEKSTDGSGQRDKGDGHNNGIGKRKKGLSDIWILLGN